MSEGGIYGRGGGICYEGGERVYIVREGRWVCQERVYVSFTKSSLTCWLDSIFLIVKSEEVYVS